MAGRIERRSGNFAKRLDQLPQSAARFLAFPEDPAIHRVAGNCYSGCGWGLKAFAIDHEGTGFYTTANVFTFVPGAKLCARRKGDPLRSPRTRLK